MHWLIHSLALALSVRFAKRSRRQHAERAGQHGSHIREHVAEQIVGDNHVELLGPAHELHAERVSEHVIELHIGIFALVQSVGDFMPQDAGLHDVALFRRGDFVVALAREFKRHTADALDFVSVIDLRINAALLAIAQIDDFLRLAEVNAARQFAHDHNVEALDNLALQRRSISKGRIANGGAQIGKQAEIFAQTQEAGFRAHIIGNRIPLGATDRAENHGVAFHGEFHVAFGNRLAMRVIGGTTDEAVFSLERGNAGTSHPIGHFHDFGHDFGTNAVAGQQEEFKRRHGGLPWERVNEKPVC